MKKFVLPIAITFGFMLTLTAQDTPGTASITGPQKDNAWEFGLHAGHLFTKGNVKFIPGYAGGIHVRRALDYVFALRLDLLYGSARGEDDGNVRSFDNTWMSGSLQAIVSLNNLKWTLGERKSNIYFLGGFGLNSFKADLEGEGAPFKVDNEVAAHAEVGAGIAFRVTNRVNIGLEHKVAFVLGERSDLLDAVPTINTPDERSTLKDALNYTAVRLNLNVGKLADKTEPLYWVNPMDGVIADLNRMKDARTNLVDADGDGVPDALDEEENTPAGATVNAKGVTLDSDGDGIPDYQDAEPFSPPGYTVDSQGKAQVPDVLAEARKYVDERLRNFQPAGTTTTTPAAPTAPPSGIYLPNIYFQQGGSQVSNLHIGTLASISQILKANPGLRFVVTGHTDEKGTEAANNRLSYNRAKAVIDLLVEKFTVPRSQLILHWKGEGQTLVPGFVEVNRRVEFRVATAADTEMEEPKGK
jgi:outer membrane protein OmpA-like peptidoglycan-associated protein